MKCCNFEVDEEIALEGDKPCCQICKYFNSVTDTCYVVEEE
jgi:hypothetical protein